MSDMTHAADAAGAVKPIHRLPVVQQVALAVRHGGMIVDVRAEGSDAPIIGQVVSVARNPVTDGWHLVVNTKPGSYTGTAIPLSTITSIRRLA